MIEIQEIKRLTNSKLEVTVKYGNTAANYIVIAGNKGGIKSLNYSDELSQIIGDNLKSAQGFQSFYTIIWRYLNDEQVNLPCAL